MEDIAVIGERWVVLKEARMLGQQWLLVVLFASKQALEMFLIVLAF
jgi:hypothetical protein